MFLRQVSKFVTCHVTMEINCERVFACQLVQTMSPNITDFDQIECKHKAFCADSSKPSFCKSVEISWNYGLYKMGTFCIQQCGTNTMKNMQNWFFIKIMTFGHNFWTRNVRWPIKGSKDLDYCLVCNKNLSQKISSFSWGPGPDKLGQKGLNQPHLWCHSQKYQNP